MEVMEDVIERNELSEGSHWHGEESCGCERERERECVCVVGMNAGMCVGIQVCMYIHLNYM